MSARPGRKDLSGPPDGWTFGYISKKTQGVCPHEPACTPDRSRCGPQPKQALAHANVATVLFYGGAAGGGKATAPETLIPTPQGFTTMGALVVGDRVFDERGQPCNVVAKTPLHIDPQGTYRLTFDDGSTIVAGGAHEWWTFTSDERSQEQRRDADFKARRRAARPSRGLGKRPDLAQRNRETRAPGLSAPPGGIRTTREIAETLLTRRGHTNHSVPLGGTWNTAHVDLPIDPYVLGAWLGDGTTVSGGFTSADPFIVEQIRAAGYTVKPRTVVNGWHIHGFIGQLRSLGVLGNKHVPASYLTASANQRLALLQGLMDTDGCANRDGQAEFCSTRSVLADAVFQLAASLGCKPTRIEKVAKFYGRVIGPKFTIKWTSTLRCFRLPRKLDRLPTRVRATQTRRFIVGCERIADTLVQCITVDSPTHLYLCGEASIPTHNSFWAIVEAVTLCLLHRSIQVAIFRRTSPELRQSIILDFLLLVPRFIAVYNKTDSCARFWNGSIIWFCYAKYEQDVYKYQSAQWDALFIDEASHFTEFQVLYLITRVRSATGFRKRICLTSNPGNVGHGWLKRWFIRPVPDELGVRPTPVPFQVWRPYPKPNDPTPAEQIPTRCFIPAYFDDNFALKAGDPFYLAQIYALGGDKAKQLAEGDWDANDSMIVGGFWKERLQVGPDSTLHLVHGLAVGTIIPWHIIPNPHWKPPKGALIYGSVDYGYGVPWSFHLHAALPGGHMRTFFEYYMPRKRDKEQAQMIAHALRTNGWRPEWIVMDPSMWNTRKEHGLSKSIAEVYHDELGSICQLQPGAAGRGARVSRPQRWLDALQTAPDGLPFWTCTTACPDLIRTVPDVPWDAKDPDVEDDMSESHCIAEGTPVETIDGPKPIEQIVVGDQVLTRDGYRPVVRAWQTYPMADVFELECSDGRTLRGTADHHVWIEGRGWVELGSTTSGFVLCDLWNAQRSFPRPFRSGEGSATIADPQAPTSIVSGEADSIGESGRTSLGQFRPGITSIIATAIGRTTLLKTWRRLWPTSISRCTAPPPPLGSARPGAGTSRLPKRLGWLFPSRFRSPARTAVDLANRSGLARSDFARPGAASEPAMQSVFVIAVRPAGRAPVYDLTVQDVHEFFANGILVQNCYEDTGRFFEARPFIPRAQNVDPLADLDAISRQHQAAIAAKHGGRGAGAR